MSAILKIFGLPGTIALAAAVILALLLAGCTAGLVLNRAELKNAKAEISLVKLERDSAVATADNNATAAESWETIADTRNVMLLVCQNENTRVAAEGEAALARAQAKARDAERTLSQFTEKYAASIRLPECAAARARLDAACPALDY